MERSPEICCLDHVNTLGTLAIGILGLAVIAGGLYQIYKGLMPGFDRQFQIYRPHSKGN